MSARFVVEYGHRALIDIARVLEGIDDRDDTELPEFGKRTNQVERDALLGCL